MCDYLCTDILLEASCCLNCRPILIRMSHFYFFNVNMTMYIFSPWFGRKKFQRSIACFWLAVIMMRRGMKGRKKRCWLERRWRLRLVWSVWAMNWLKVRSADPPVKAEKQTDNFTQTRNPLKERSAGESVMKDRNEYSRKPVRFGLYL